MRWMAHNKTFKNTPQAHVLKTSFIIVLLMVYLQLTHRVRHIIAEVPEQNVPSDANNIPTKKPPLN